ncbi:thiosulfate sulfurtransferase (rhodanese)-like domain-containing protein 2 [Mortierella polycephala]|uniref:Thiosulfate sulfurtransferase (Rhodanese)-like domain-containing protein 2 n=1 Tax=Mortierella polycephala TaxID=41804 RepID=A0A9P6QJR7_9FUNG|nr:thiosulfate sulfurtransferase (rhodanese)-like domain-containing protein 2 [Mortierella polycephala]
MTQFRTARNRAQNALLRDRKTGDSSWTCCGMTCDDAPAMYRHIVAAHEDDLQHQAKIQLASMQSRVVAQGEDEEAEFKSRRAEKYGSDPISLTCNCDPTQGTVILFYTYIPIKDPLNLAKLHKSWSSELDLCGKVKVAKEGINATLAGSSASITAYIDNLTKLPDFQSLQLSQSVFDQAGTALDNFEQRRFKFFKPTEGCRHVFGAVISIKVVDEICPLGAPELCVYDDPDNKRCKLPPREFHQRLKEVEGRDDVVVLDVRNYYESSIGHFPGAITPPIRKFSSFRDYVDRNKDQFSGKTVLSYCTGGIRCEKATSYLRQSLGSREGSQPSEILMLEGGIHNYLEWIKQEGSIAESLWLGKNYVFDARQALGLEDLTSTNADHKGERLIAHR